MPRRRGRHSQELNVWPAFVDVLATLLLVIILLVLVVTMTQFYTANRANTAERIGDQLSERLLSQTQTISELEAARQSLLAQLDTQLDELGILTADRDEALAAAEDLLIKLAQSDAVTLEGSLADAFNQMDEKLDRLLAVLSASEAANAALNADNEALNSQISNMTADLDSLGERINDSLLAQTEELQRQRSLFFASLINTLGDRSDISIVGDRFVFQSEVLFESGSADLGDAGQAQLTNLAFTILSLAVDFPDDLDWILRIDGHTDARPISSSSDSGFENNWQLSTERARTVVQFLIDEGVPAQRLAATGFGEHQPLNPALTSEADAQNRRIEIKLTTR